MKTIRKFLGILSDEVVVRSPDFESLDEAVFAYNDYVEQYMLDTPSVLDVDVDALMSDEADEGFDIESQIPAAENFRILRQYSNQGIGDVSVSNNWSDDAIEVQIRVYKSPNNKHLQKALKEMREGTSFNLERGIIKAIGPEDGLEHYTFILSSTFALGLAAKRGYFNIDDMANFYASLEYYPDEVFKETSSSMAYNYMGITPDDKPFGERMCLAQAYLGAAAIYELSKEIPIIRHLEPIRELMQAVEQTLKED